MQILNVATAVIHGFLHVAAIVLWEQCVGCFSLLLDHIEYYITVKFIPVLLTTAQILQVFTSFSLHYVTCVCCL